MSPGWLKRVRLLQFPSEHGFVQLACGREAHLLFGSRYPSVLLPGSSGVGASCAGSTHEQVADWRSVGEPVIKKSLQIALSAFPPPLWRGKYCQQLKWSAHSSFSPPTILLRQELSAPAATGGLSYGTVFFKEEGANWCPLWSFSSRL